MATRKTVSRKRANNDLDSDSESPDVKRRRVEFQQPIPTNQRHFYHIQSNAPYFIGGTNDSVDSEDEIEYNLLYQPIYRKKMNKLLNESEIEFVNLWNSFIERQKYFGLQQLRMVCQKFIDSNIQNILQKNLYREFLIHLCVLHDQCQLTSSQYMQLVQYFQRNVSINGFRNTTNATRQITSTSSSRTDAIEIENQ